MNKVRVLTAVPLLVATAIAHAELAVTPAIVSDYDFRGITQTNEKPAFQLGIDYAFESGFYLNAWGSNVDFGPGDPNMEVDFGAGFAGGDAENSFGYDVGVVSYLYPGASDINMLEFYAGVSKGPFDAKFWYSPDNAGSGRSAYYLEGNVLLPLAENFAFVGHAGWSDGDAWNSVGGYYDWSVGVEWAASNVTLGLKYVDGDSDVVEGRVIGSISVSLPWSSP